MERKKDLIFLIGYMGAGKSTIGKKLAFVLGYKFVDTDRYLEKFFKKTMTEIFKDPGEAAFREEEEKLIERMSRRTKQVVSAGGGTLTRTETFYTAQRTGVLIYLKAPLDVLYERAVFSQKDRPLINVPDSEARFRQRFKAREPYYVRADYTIETDGRQSDEVVQELVAWLQQP